MLTTEYTFAAILPPPPWVRPLGMCQPCQEKLDRGEPAVCMCVRYTSTAAEPLTKEVTYG